MSHHLCWTPLVDILRLHITNFAISYPIIMSEWNFSTHNLYKITPISTGCSSENPSFNCAPRHCATCISGLRACMVFLLTDWVFSKMHTEMVYIVVMTIKSGKADHVTKSPCHRAIAICNFSNSHCRKLQCQQVNNAASSHTRCKQCWYERFFIERETKGDNTKTGLLLGQHP